MAYTRELVDRIRKAFASISYVEEKKMFGSLAFVVNGKMCVTAGPGRIMCRIHPELHDQEVKKDGCSTVVMRGREYKGNIYIRESCLKTESDLMYWINLSLEFNRQLTSGRDDRIPPAK